MREDIQKELQKIHHQFGVSEKANYEIQKLFDDEVDRFQKFQDDQNTWTKKSSEIPN